MLNYHNPKRDFFSALFARGGQGSRNKTYVMNIEEKKADFMRRFKASRERKAEYIAQMEKRMRDDYRREPVRKQNHFVYCDV